MANTTKTAAKEIKAGEGLQITLKRGLVGRTKRQIAVAHSLGLKRAGDVCVQPNNGPTKGKIAKIDFLVEVETV